MNAADLGIDLGTSSILVYVRGKGVVLKEPSVVAFDKDTNRIKAIGEEARMMLGRTPGNIVAIRPLRKGVISDYTITEHMLKYFIQKSLGRMSFRKPRISICVPSGITEVEKKAVEDAASIDDKNALPELKDCTFRIACDVTNPLCGEKGCSAVFGPQKGADEPMIHKMDQWLAHYAALAAEKYPEADPSYPGAGAAGGLGFAFLTFLHGKLESGIQIVLEETRLADYVKDADLVITGEGRLDGQTVFGKAPIGVAKTAKQYGKPVLAFSGCVTPDASACNQAGIDAFFPILRTVTSLEEAMDPRQAMKNMEDTVEQVFRVIKTFH